MTNRILKSYLPIFLCTYALMHLCSYGVMPSYAEEQYIAESFGLYSKGVEYYHTGKLHEAKEILERAVRLDSRNDEAQGYLDLVNAEIRMRAKGMLDYYQGEASLERESDLGIGERRIYAEVPDYEAEAPDYEYEDEYYELMEELEYRYSRREGPEEEPGLPEDEIKVVIDALNENIAPSQIRGEYKMAFGVTSEDLLWKDANGDYNERNFRMINEQFPKINTFDTRVYDRLKVAFDTNKGGEGLNLHSDITVDPWSFVGKTNKVTINNNLGGDRTEIELKYWSGNRSTINETIPTLIQGDAIALPEIKVIDGKTTPVRVVDTFDQVFAIPELEIDRSFQPVRELWFDYRKDDYKFRIFPFGLEDQALSSDDPLGLSNHHIYWEPSPWLDEWKPGNFNSASVPSASFTSGEWSDDLSFFTRDSDLTRLTALRGVAFQGIFLDNTDLSLTVASPKGLWQDYDSVATLPGAIRTKTQITDSLMIGAIDTFRIGYTDERTDSYNNVFGIDASYDLNPATNIVGEVAFSKSEDDRTNNTYKTEKDGSAVHVSLKKDTNYGNARLAFTHMDKGFDPGLANYRETRRDQFWGRRIHFKKPLEYYEGIAGPTLNYEDIEPFRIGDGIDAGRNAFNFRLDTKDALDGKMDNLMDYRYVRDSDHKYVEGVFREENTLRLNPEWTSKFLFIYHDLPKTKGGVDPIKYDSDTGEFLLNSAIEEDKDPSLSTYSLGVEYAPEDWISIFGIYENTNDSTFATDNHPRALLNDFSFATETIEGQAYRNKSPFLYSQGFFDLPPYERFDIYRTGISLKPSENLGIDFDFTKNDFKFAAGIDDNINHFGTTLKYRFNTRLIGYLRYTYSKSYNLFRLNTSGDLKYEDHHNIFMELNYNVTEYGLLTIQFGEGSVVSPVWGATASPFGDFYPTLDTQHILRVYYHGRF